MDKHLEYHHHLLVKKWIIHITDFAEKITHKKMTVVVEVVVG